MGFISCIPISLISYIPWYCWVYALALPHGLLVPTSVGSAVSEIGAAGRDRSGERPGGCHSFGGGPSVELPLWRGVLFVLGDADDFFDACSGY